VVVEVVEGMKKEQKMAGRGLQVFTHREQWFESNITLKLIN